MYTTPPRRYKELYRSLKAILLTPLTAEMLDSRM
jgi:hypothetical protein